MRNIFYFVLCGCVVWGFAGEAMANQDIYESIFTTKGKLLRCNVDAANKALQPGGPKLSQEHYRHINWCFGFVDGVLETLQRDNDCLRNASAISLSEVVAIAQNRITRADFGPSPLSPAEAVKEALLLISRCD